MILEYCEIPLYRGLLGLCITDNPIKINKELKTDYKSKDELYASTWLTDYKEKQMFFILLNFNHKYRKVKYGTIVHEINHAGNFIQRERSITLDVNNDESDSYLKEWIGDKIFEWLNEHNYIKEIDL